MILFASAKLSTTRPAAPIAPGPKQKGRSECSESIQNLFRYGIQPMAFHSKQRVARKTRGGYTRKGVYGTLSGPGYL